MLVIPLCRDLLLDPTGSNWRDVCIIPTVIAIVCMLLICLFIRESDVFLDNRIAYLQIPYEEREAQMARKKQNKEVDTSKAGLGTAIKYIAKNKQLRNIVLSYGVFLLGMNSFVTYFNTICMKHGMTTDNITSALYIYPLASALATLIAGFISDKLGRKVTCAIYCVVAFSSLLLYINLAGVINPLIIGGFYGLCYGGYWTIGDTISIMLSESSRTEIRSSVSAAAGFIALFASLVSTAVYGALVLSVDITVLCVAGAVITMLLMLVLLFLGTKETKGTILE